ncbi:hypothetical protein UT300012_24210 [Paraclostridium bifermentans]
MKYADYDFTIDHIFDFIRIFFSIIFIAPWRYFHNMTIKLTFIDKDKLIKFAQLSVGINVLLIVCEVIGLLSQGKFSIMYTRIPALFLCFILLAVVYYLIGVYDQPMIKYGKKPKKIIKKDPIAVPTDFGIVGANALLDDEEEIEETIEESQGEVATLNEEESPHEVEDDFTMDFGDKLSGFVDTEKLRETSQEYQDILESAYLTDEFNINEFTNLSSSDFGDFASFADDEDAQGDLLSDALDGIEFDDVAM